jgi:hypothetical protein
MNMVMMSFEEFKKLFNELVPNPSEYTDEEIEEIRDAMYGIGELAVEQTIKVLQSNQKNTKSKLPKPSNNSNTHQN